MMSSLFDQPIDRRTIFNLNQWQWYPQDVLPLWLADMNFRAPQAILDALRAALDHGILGYEIASPALHQRIAERLARLYRWPVTPDSIVPVPGVNIAVRLTASLACKPGQGVLVMPPVFYHFISFPQSYGLVRQDAPLRRLVSANRLRYSVDFDQLRQAFHSHGRTTGMFLLCNPHNPTGQVYTRQELTEIAQICREKDVLICSDDIHSELLLGGAEYTPLAALSPETAERTITLISPGKTFNISGLDCAFAIIPQPELRRRFEEELERQALSPSSLGLTAAAAAYSGECDGWLDELRAYLTTNRDEISAFLTRELPEVRFTCPAATYLAWLDCSAYTQSGQISGSPQEYFLEKAKLALFDGAAFGPGGEGFVRLNFACPRSILSDALGRLKGALRGSSHLS